MDDRTEKIGAALERLFRTYPQSDRGDALDVALERMERAKVYLEALEPYDIRDIEAGCHAFVTGTAPGVNPAFIPPAPQVAAEVRRQMNLRLDSERRTAAFRPKLPPPDIERTTESQQRVRELMETTVAGLKRVTEETDGDSVKRKADQWGRTNVRFYPDLNDAEMEARLGFSVGDKDEQDAA